VRERRQSASGAGMEQHTAAAMLGVELGGGGGGGPADSGLVGRNPSSMDLSTGSQQLQQLQQQQQLGFRPSLDARAGAQPPQPTTLSGGVGGSSAPQQGFRPALGGGMAGGGMGGGMGSSSMLGLDGMMGGPMGGDSPMRGDMRSISMGGGMRYDPMGGGRSPPSLCAEQHAF
jgi:hypothetical protein